MAYMTNKTESTQTSALLADLARVGVPLYRAQSSPKVCADFVSDHGKTLFAAEWGLDSDQDVSRGGTISCGPFKDCQWMLVADGHGTLSTVPRFLRSLSDLEFERCMSTNDPGAELEKLLAAGYPGGTEESGACIVMARMTLCGEIELWNAGDSRGIVLAEQDGEVTTLVRTVDHSAENRAELLRLLQDKHSATLDDLPSDPNLEELQQAGLECGLLQTDASMLKPLPPVADSGRPRATMEPGLRVNFSSAEKEFQMSRSIGHQPLGVTGRNWDYYRVRAPVGARVHVILASDGLWDVEPSTDLLFQWCEAGGNAMLHRLAERWVGDWDFEHPWTHGCLDCRQRRIDFLEAELAAASSDRHSERVTAQLCIELNGLVRACQNVERRSAVEARLRELPSENDQRFRDLLVQEPLTPDVPYNGRPVRTVQHGIKPDDLSLALCSWNVRGHVTVVKGLVSRMDTPAVFDFATSHPLLGDHCIGVHWDGDGYSDAGMQECIFRTWKDRQGSLPIQPALRARTTEEREQRSAAGKTDDVLLDNETPCTSTWEAALGRSLAEAGIDVCDIPGPDCGEDHTERFARHGLAHLALVQRVANHPKNKVPILVLCVGSGQVTAREQARASPSTPFYILNVDRPVRNSTEREAPAIRAPPSYPPPAEVDWTPDPSGTPSLATPQLWLMWGGCPRRYAPTLPIEGVLAEPEGDANPLESCLGITVALQSRPHSA
tara:strand:- start:3797 stop:5962 length:2166 start_codon:yes stop_codon:yes gene_type:complete